MKILFYLAVWKRPEITEVCFMGLNRLKNTGLFPMEFMAVISEGSMIPLCKKYNIEYCFYKNLPLGEKKNFGLNECLKKSWDYLIELGSDDILKSEILELYKFDKPTLYLNHIAFINSETQECRALKSQTFYGIGRAIRRDCFQSVTTLEGCKLWQDKANAGLDSGSNFLLSANGFLGKQVKCDYPIGIDIKSKENIWAYNPEAGYAYDFEKLLKGLSQEEKTAIRCLSKKA